MNKKNQSFGNKSLYLIILVSKFIREHCFCLFFWRPPPQRNDINVYLNWLECVFLHRSTRYSTCSIKWTATCSVCADDLRTCFPYHFQCKEQWTPRCSLGCSRLPHGLHQLHHSLPIFWYKTNSFLILCKDLGDADSRKVPILCPTHQPVAANVSDSFILKLPLTTENDCLRLLLRETCKIHPSEMLCNKIIAVVKERPVSLQLFIGCFVLIAPKELWVCLKIETV